MKNLNPLSGFRLFVGFALYTPFLTLWDICTARALIVPGLIR